LAQNKKDASTMDSLSKSIEKDKKNKYSCKMKKNNETILKKLFSMGNQSFEIQARTIKK